MKRVPRVIKNNAERQYGTKENSSLNTVALSCNKRSKPIDVMRIPTRINAAPSSPRRVHLISADSGSCTSCLA